MSIFFFRGAARRANDLERQENDIPKELFLDDSEQADDIVWTGFLLLFGLEKTLQAAKNLDREKLERMFMIFVRLNALRAHRRGAVSEIKKVVKNAIKKKHEQKRQENENSNNAQAQGEE